MKKLALSVFIALSSLSAFSASEKVLSCDVYNRRGISLEKFNVLSKDNMKFTAEFTFAPFNKIVGLPEVTIIHKTKYIPARLETALFKRGTLVTAFEFTGVDRIQRAVYLDDSKVNQGNVVAASYQEYKYGPFAGPVENLVFRNCRSYLE